MARTSDIERILWMLYENGVMSNLQIRSKLGMDDERYQKVRQELLEQDLVSKRRGRGGGVELTKKGEKYISPAEPSVSKKEKEIYAPYAEVLRSESEENEEVALVCNTSGLRKRGKWANPDIVKISLENYPTLSTKAITLTTYEVKSKEKWDSSAVFEAASHGLFSNRSYVVIEKEKDNDVTDLEDMISLCRKFGVGLITLHPHYNGYRQIIQYEAEAKNPPFSAMEEYLSYVFERLAAEKSRFEELKKENFF